jgi:hydrophobe/amphiphile efflux-1 (HAE1) family protein
MFSKVFIDRPIFASVLSIIIVLAGGAAMLALPLAQYPEIAPPSVSVTATYPGADAKVVAETVAATIEQQVNGVEKMLYMSSQSSNDGSYTLTVTFELGTNVDIAQVLVQNRVAVATPQLPDAVKQIGVTVKKKSPSILLAVNLYSPDGQYDSLYLSNYATIQVRDELARLTGVGDVTYMGQRDYSMRVWLDPEKMAIRNLTATDVVNALREQNVQVAAGKLGQPPVDGSQAFQYTLTTLGRLTDPSEFADIIVQTGKDGQITRISDIGRTELGAKNLDQACTLDGKPSVGLAVYQLPGSNAVATAELVREKMEELSARFPDGLDYKIVYDTTPFIEESINQVFHTLIEAVVLVALVVIVFLQNWRSSLIPLIAVPVSIIGTLAALAMFGFSLNNLTLFGLVLAIGIVVDDAIVVVEAVELNMAKGMNPYDASIAAMKQVGGAVIAIGFVLMAVFIPCVFITGITGEFFRQFALTIAVSVAISTFNSLTLSPALSAVLLKPHHDKPDILQRMINLLFGWFFKIFNKVFDKGSGAYAWGVGWLVRLALIVLVVYGGLLFLTYKSFTAVPMGFVPAQDKGYLLTSIQLPDAASLDRTREIMARAEQIALNQPGVAHTMSIAGQSMLLNVNGSNYGTIFVIFEEFEKRAGIDELYGDNIAVKLQRELYAQIPQAQIGVFGAPPVDGLGSAGGFKLMVQDRANSGFTALAGQTDELASSLTQQPPIARAFGGFSANTPQYFVDIDRTKVKSLGIPLNDVFLTLSTFLGGNYTNDFNQFGRTWQVNLQAEAPYRMKPDDVSRLKVRNPAGEMVPLGTLLSLKEIGGPVSITRYNSYPAAPINGVPGLGVSSGDVINVVNAVAKKDLPSTMSYEWTELTLLQIMAGNTAIIVFAFAVVFVFLVLAAQYESWAMPLSVILVVPMCLLFSVIGIAMAKMDINIFVQIGFIVLVGLACKNAILIVEYAHELEDREGKSTFDAVVEACRLRLRPILMTSFAFILGVVPLAIATGAGAEMRKTLGIAVLAGMIGVTLFGIFLTPVFYYVIRKYTAKSKAEKSAGHAAHGHEEPKTAGH